MNGPAKPNDKHPEFANMAMLRVEAAIELCVPDSGHPWLDDMIRRAQRQRYKMAVTGALRITGLTRGEVAAIGEYADALVAEEEAHDAMLAERTKAKKAEMDRLMDIAFVPTAEGAES